MVGAILNANHTFGANVTNSTFYNNHARFGGSIYNHKATLTVTNSTFSGNHADLGGGFIYQQGAVVTIKSTILAASGSDNCAGNNGPIIDAGYNISDDATCGFTATGSSNNTDPMLDPTG